METNEDSLWTINCSEKNLLTFRLGALVVLRAKMKRGAKMMVFYRHGYCVCTPMWFDAEAVAPVRLALAWFPPPPNFFIITIQQPGNSFVSMQIATESNVTFRKDRWVSMRIVHWFLLANRLECT
jgi:hypothetical protein